MREGVVRRWVVDHPHVGGDLNGIAGEKEEAGGDNGAERIAMQSAHGPVEFEVEVGPLLPGQIAPRAQQVAVAAGLMDGANAHARHHDEKERQECGERMLAAEAQKREMAVIIVGW
jgi:hypothetical protein